MKIILAYPQDLESLPSDAQIRDADGNWWTRTPEGMWYAVWED